jgi:polygalacturonase
MKIVRLGLTGIIVLSSIIIQAQQYYDVLKFGANNDSTKLSTAAIEKAITAASKAGGGTVYFPAGKYLTGPIHLKSNITLLIDAGAELHFSDLPMVPSRWEGTNVVNFSPLFYAYKAENISITGRGIIDGHGKKWWGYSEGYDYSKPKSNWERTFIANNPRIIPPEEAKMINRGFLRPPFIQFLYCKNVLIEGISIRNSPFWTINPEFCENVTIHAVTINNPHSPNTDGINPESCKYVHISDCHINVGDDCITIKSGKDEDGRRNATPAEDYTITNCTMLAGHGGVVIGSEMSGGVKKIVISNCIFDGTDRGIRIKTTRGRGGIVEDIRVDNLIMKNIKEQAIVLDMQYSKGAAQPVTEKTPVFRNIHFSNITGQAKQAGFINGLEEMPVEQITFSDIQIEAEMGFVVKEATHIAFHQVLVTTKMGASFTFEHVNSIELDGISSYHPHAEVPMILLKNTSDVFVHNCWTVSGTNVFTQISGATTENIVIKNNNLKNVKQILLKDPSVSGDITVE